MRRAIGVSLLLLALCACRGSDAETATTDAVPAAPITTASPPESPLEARLGFASEPGRRQHQLVALQDEASAELVECMRSAGFFYVAPSTDVVVPTARYQSDGTRGFAERIGFGVTTAFVDTIRAEAAVAAPDAAETNLNYVASLTAEQAADYDRALVGEQAPGEPASEFTPEGCWGAAFGEILTQVSLFAEFEEELAALNARLAADPRVTVFEASWAACMAEAGFRYENRTALIDDLYARLLEIELVELGGVAQFASHAAVDELVAYEREVAVASHDCSASYAAELRRLRFDYEQEFLDDNRFRLAELLGP